jgi:hypothetical protein
MKPNEECTKEELIEKCANLSQKLYALTWENKSLMSLCDKKITMGHVFQRMGELMVKESGEKYDKESLDGNV